MSLSQTSQPLPKIKSTPSFVMSQYSLEGHVALVTGSSKGLGAEVARGLAEAGASVVVNAFNNIARGEEVAEEIIAKGGREHQYFQAAVVLYLANNHSNHSRLEQALLFYRNLHKLIRASRFHPVSDV